MDIETLTTGYYRSSTPNPMYHIKLAQASNIFMSTTGSGGPPVIYTTQLERVGELRGSVHHLPAGEYYIQINFASSNREISLYIPSAGSYQSLPALVTGQHPEDYHANFYSLDLARSGNIIISPYGDSASYRIYDTELRLLQNGYSNSGAIYLEQGNYIVVTSYNASPSRTSMTAIIPEELSIALPPAQDQPLEEPASQAGDHRAEVQSLYIGLLGRAADPNGLSYWENELAAGRITLEQLRANIVNEQPEYLSGIGAQPRAEAVRSLYQNLFNRDPEPDGHAYWVSGEGRGVNFDQLVLALISGASPVDTLSLTNRVQVANAFTAATSQHREFNKDSARVSLDQIDATAELDLAIQQAEQIAAGETGPASPYPPTPQNVEAISLPSLGNLISWDLPGIEYDPLGAVYVYRSATPDKDHAELIAIVTNVIFLDDDPAVTNQSFYYWIGFVSEGGLKGGLQAASNGMPAKPSPSAQSTIDAAIEELSQSPLPELLNTPIDSITGTRGPLELIDTTGTMNTDWDWLV